MVHWNWWGVCIQESMISVELCFACTQHPCSTIQFVSLQCPLLLTDVVVVLVVGKVANWGHEFFGLMHENFFIIKHLN
jgi:hypothetical protein